MTVTAAEFESARRFAEVQTARFVRRLPSYYDRDAFLGEAFCAVAVAAQRFDPARGVLFVTYASALVEGALRHEKRRQFPGNRSRYEASFRGEDRAVRFVPLDAPRQDEDGLPCEYPIWSERWEDAVEWRIAVRQLLARLSPWHRDVMELRMLGLPQTEVAHRLGTTQMTISRREKGALIALRRLFWAE